MSKTWHWATSCQAGPTELSVQEGQAGRGLTLQEWWSGIEAVVFASIDQRVREVRGPAYGWAFIGTWVREMLTAWDTGQMECSRKCVLFSEGDRDCFDDIRPLAMAMQIYQDPCPLQISRL